MASKHGTKKIILFLSISFCSLLSCKKNTNQIEQEITNNDSLKSGDLVVRKGNGYFSDIFKQMGSRDKKYSHIGILSRESDSLFVYHIEASEFTGEGYALRENLVSFLRNAKAHAFFANHSDSLPKVAMIAKAKEYFRLKVKFDLKFDGDDDAELYCTELVAKCINYGLDSLYIKPTLNLKGKFFYGLDDIYSKEVFSEIK